jgi:hypothetical protein
MATPTEEFKAKIRKVLNESDRGWVVDGSYAGKGGNIVLEECTDAICKSTSPHCRDGSPTATTFLGLDPPFMLYFPRIFVRTMYRLLGLAPTCSPGCPETFRTVFFSRDSILWWCVTNHWVSRRRERARMVEIGVETGTDEQRRVMRRFGGWGGELQRWFKEVENMVIAKQKVV